MEEYVRVLRDNIIVEKSSKNKKSLTPAPVSTMIFVDLEMRVTTSPNVLTWASLVRRGGSDSRFRINFHRVSWGEEQNYGETVQKRSKMAFSNAKMNLCGETKKFHEIFQKIFLRDFKSCSQKRKVFLLLQFLSNMFANNEPGPGPRESPSLR